MTPSDDFFTPEEVDVQIDALLHSSGQLQETEAREAHVIAQIHRFYTQTPGSHLSALERAWERIITENHPVKTASPGKGKLTFIHTSQETQHIRKSEPHARPRHPLLQRLSMLAAILVASLLVGGIALVLNATRQPTNIGSPSASTKTPSTQATAPTKTPPTQGIGTALSTVQFTGFGSNFNGLVWSPDSTRVAAAVLTGVQIWDAATGKNLVHVQVPPASVNGEVYVYSLAWSPNSQLLALAARDNLLIVNGQTGAIVHQYGMN
ncbi:MAG: WD40 repeat domain-containing protein, partial [Ktedonobacteraceae bacterium]